MGDSVGSEMRTGRELIRLASELPPAPLAFEDMTIPVLRKLLEKHGLPYSGMKKADLVAAAASTIR